MDLQYSTSLSNSSDKLRCKKRNHEGRPIQILCLQNQCKGNRFGCSYCHGDRNNCHSRHNIVFLTQKGSNPILKNLKAYADDKNAQTLKRKFAFYHQNIKNKLTQTIDQIWNKLLREFININFEFETLEQTFDDKLFEDIVYGYKKYVDQERSEGVENCVAMINFLALSLPLFNDAEDLNEKGNKIHDYLCSELERISSEFSNMLAPLRKKLLTDDFLTGKSQTRSSVNTMSNAMLNEKSNGLSNVTLNEKSNGLSNVTTVGMSSKNIHEKFFNIRQVSQSSQIQSVDSIMQQEAIVHQQPQQTEHFPNIRQAFGCSQINDQSVNPLMQQQVNVNDQPQQINQQMTIQIPNKHLQILQTKIKQLKSLTVNEEELDKNIVEHLLKRVSNLKDINIVGSTSFQEDVVNMIIKYVPEIKQINSQNDWHYNFPQILIDSYFDKEPTPNFFDITVCQKLPELKMLENLQIEHPDQQITPNIIQKMKALKSIKLGGSKKAKLSNEVLKQLALKTNLISITLQNIIFDNIELFCQFIANNKHLQTICLSNCQGMDDQILNSIQKNCKNLKTLYLNQISNIRGLAIWTMLSLKSLILRNCYQIDSRAALSLQNLIKMQNLEISFTLYQKSWVNDSIFQAMNFTKTLKSLNISGCTRISMTTFRIFKKMHELETLIIENITLTKKALLVLLDKCPKLKRLNLGKINLKLEQIEQILSSLNLLTHLNLHIISMFFKNSKQALFKYIRLLWKLQVLVCNKNLLDEQQIEFLAKKGKRVVFRDHR